uniref:ATP synthase F0 subunit 8 n=1 Tax=Blepharipoda liberata TaxID=1514702 RepID=UPI002181FEAB|nr:ATP synthase F0 subunit 8 [Blepharipoda liberata]UVN15671.1 ATP synthase F0 subunit 8 [Blepharipoda liberata]
MPQMAPLLWLNLMIMFILALLLIFIMNYFILLPTKVYTKKETLFTKEKNWSW